MVAEAAIRLTLSPTSHLISQRVTINGSQIGEGSRVCVWPAEENRSAYDTDSSQRLPKNVGDDIMLAECQIEIPTSTGEGDFEC